MAEAKATAALPLLMGCYVLFYSLWFPTAWAALGWGLFAAALIVAGAAIRRGIRQLNHAKSLPAEPVSETGQRRARQMGILNSVTHPIWMLGAVLLAALGEARYIVPLIGFVIGAHFLPIAKIMDRRIDYFLGPVAMVAAIVAVTTEHPAAVAGLGGAVSTGCYAWYMAANYRKLVTTS